jgi:hypothetical protein
MRNFRIKVHRKFLEVSPRLAMLTKCWAKVIRFSSAMFPRLRQELITGFAGVLSRAWHPSTSVWMLDDCASEGPFFTKPERV